MENKKVSVRGGIGLPGLLFLLFTGLKLTGYIDWSWVWVTAPLWIPFTLVVGFIILYVVIHATASKKRF